MAEYIERETLTTENPIDKKIKAINPQIVVSGEVDKPYYSISYYDTAKKEWFIGYGSYNLEYVRKWLNECFEEVKADVVEVVHGHNKTSMHPVDEFLCSVCGFCCADYTETKYDEDGDYEYSCECEFDYCPKCGAKMDGERVTDNA